MNSVLSSLVEEVQIRRLTILLPIVGPGSRGLPVSAPLPSPLALVLVLFLFLFLLILIVVLVVVLILVLVLGLPSTC